jgi:hypothetical protein
MQMTGQIKMPIITYLQPKAKETVHYQEKEKEKEKFKNISNWQNIMPMSTVYMKNEM